MTFTAHGKGWPSRQQYERDIIAHAERRAVGVHEDHRHGGLTPYGIASCAASTAMVLADEAHPNHRMLWERVLAGDELPVGEEVWRACARDKDFAPDCGDWTDRATAERDLATLETQPSPAFDEVWLEHRWCSAPTRIDPPPRPDPPACPQDVDPPEASG